MDYESRVMLVAKERGVRSVGDGCAFSRGSLFYGNGERQRSEGKMTGEKIVTVVVYE